MNTTTLESPALANRTPALADYKKLFIIGCPRSGTTWVQLLLAQHGAIATAPETQIFAYYVDPMRRQWMQERAGADRQQGSAGLSRLLSEEEFEELCRMNGELVLGKIAARHPGAEVIAEKSPRHALQADFIQRLFPDVYFLHVVRDPRDAAVSMAAASRSWGADWAPRNPIDAARLWRDHVVAARRAQRPERFLEVRYEELIAQPVTQLQAIHEWLGVATSSEACRAAVAACDFKQLKENANAQALPLPGDRSPKGFFRSGTSGGWMKELRPGAVRVIEHICAPLMDGLGYPRATRTGLGTTLRIRGHDAVQRIRESIDWQLQRLLWRI